MDIWRTVRLKMKCGCLEKHTLNYGLPSQWIDNWKAWMKKSDCQKCYDKKENDKTQL